MRRGIWYSLGMNAVKRGGFWLFILSLGFAALPILSVLLASVLSSVFGCPVDEGSVHACSVLGLFDIGDLLYVLFVSGWYALVTIPLGIIGAVAGGVLYAVAKVILWRRRKAGVQ